MFLSLYYLIPPFLFPPFHRVHPPLRASSSCVYSHCVVRIAVGPCAKGHFIHVMPTFGPRVLFLLLVGMRFCRYVYNSPRNKNPKRHISYLLGKVVFLDLKRLLSPLGRGENNFFFNFECHDLANGKE
jgi:hypothetical protein